MKPTNWLTVEGTVLIQFDPGTGFFELYGYKYYYTVKFQILEMIIFFVSKIIKDGQFFMSLASESTRVILTNKTGLDVKIKG